MNSIGRKLVLILLDVIFVNASFLAAYLLRFDGILPENYFAVYLRIALLVTAVHIFCYYFWGLCNKLWQYASIDELLNIVFAVSVASITIVAGVYFLDQSIPRGIFILAWLLNIVFIGGSRLAWRVLREKYLNRDRFRGGKPVLLVGAGAAGALIIKELKNGNNHGYNPVGFIDDDAGKHKQQLMGVPVLGNREVIPDIVEKYAVQEIIIAMPSAPGSAIREIVQICKSTSAKVKILPAISSIVDGQVKVNELREVQVEDLLRRESVKVNLKEISGYIENKVVLVTGAGGSIGSELCRQIITFNPSRLILLGHDENPIFEIEQELKQKFPPHKLKAVIASIREKEKVKYIFDTLKPQVVFHAAAHKHVPLMELNPEEAIKNNIFGTKNIAEAARKVGTETFIMISTDKAVNPTNVMGASKRVAEMIVQSLNKKGSTKFAAVRFGNVLGSNGSVLPIFKRQIAEGGPVTVTHPEMTRYFMTIPEAVQLVIQAGAFASGGETFILDMGEPVRIEDMARDLITLSGLKPDKDIEITYTGIRPGEKLYEELLTAEEGTTATKHKRIFIAKPTRINTQKLYNYLNQLEKYSISCNRKEIIYILKQIVPTYQTKLFDLKESKEQVG